MKDFSLSPVFNIRGREEITVNPITVEPIIDNGARKYIPIDKQYFTIDATSNCKGVGRIKSLVS
jgi:hypothetical protein